LPFNTQLFLEVHILFVLFGPLQVAVVGKCSPISIPFAVPHLIRYPLSIMTSNYGRRERKRSDSDSAWLTAL